MQKKHSQISGCPYCGHKWVQPLDHQWSAEEAASAFETHAEYCQVYGEDVIETLPEVLTVDQMKVLEHQFKSAGTPEDKWRQLYGRLFPGEEIPSPCESSLNAVVLLTDQGLQPDYDYLCVSHQQERLGEGLVLPSSSRTGYNVTDMENYSAAFEQGDALARQPGQNRTENPFLELEPGSAPLPSPSNRYFDATANFQGNGTQAYNQDMLDTLSPLAQAEEVYATQEFGNPAWQQPRPRAQESGQNFNLMTPQVTANFRGYQPYQHPQAWSSDRDGWGQPMHRPVASATGEQLFNGAFLANMHWQNRQFGDEAEHEGHGQFPPNL